MVTYKITNAEFIGSSIRYQVDNDCTWYSIPLFERIDGRDHNSYININVYDAIAEKLYECKIEPTKNLLVNQSSTYQRDYLRAIEAKKTNQELYQFYQDCNDDFNRVAWLDGIADCNLNLYGLSRYADVTINAYSYEFSCNLSDLIEPSDRYRA